jgi:ABC-type glutathione transport system ATPase component
VDEVLAFGDINFQHKCLRKIADLMAQCAVILVNHNTDIIRFACQRVLFLNKGRSQFIGSATQGVEEYTNFMIRRELPEMIPSGTQYDSVVAVESVKFFDELGNEVTEVYAGKPLILKCTFSASRPIPKAILGVAFYLDARERSFICYSSQVENRQIFNVTNGQHEFIVHISRVDLKAGIYHIAVMVCEKNELATHTWNTNKFLVIKNPRPEFGFYNMVCKFEIK